jgi:(4S)-4-hydroxy-5-phosphonooxypentane-2,3-dione isomerase
MFVVTVFFEISPQFAEEFRPAILKNAALSLTEEPGCHRFDVCFSKDSFKCFLYELYTDEEAFNHHLTTAHFRDFNQMSGPWVINKRLETYLLTKNPFEK